MWRKLSRVIEISRWACSPSSPDTHSLWIWVLGLRREYSPLELLTIARRNGTTRTRRRYTACIPCPTPCPVPLPFPPQSAKRSLGIRISTAERQRRFPNAKLSRQSRIIHCLWEPITIRDTNFSQQMDWPLKAIFNRARRTLYVFFF